MIDQGLVWGLAKRPENAHFTDDIRLLFHSQKDLQEKIDKVDSTARRVGLKAKMYAISSDTHQFQCIKLHHFKLEIF